MKKKKGEKGQKEDINNKNVNLFSIKNPQISIVIFFTDLQILLFVPTRFAYQQNSFH